MRQKLRQKCVKNARNTFGGEHLLDDTDQSDETLSEPFRFCALVGCTRRGSYSAKGRVSAF